MVMRFTEIESGCCDGMDVVRITVGILHRKILSFEGFVRNV